ncbi:hypothetical protein BDF21DRAFT_469289 [Thamnidium elegans]|uniref:SWIM-type domain-containing protein n=1 Tax=Thamnidium elegans TaxID=101142 RepID=A0A8H7SNS2_9FUNG|nr:hypothetical protein INT48_004892 [Thamnidium elegans]KAI8047773.1 hypothetical protein BDF21DRAFT_469289 [Thamnidium elegans]
MGNRSSNRVESTHANIKRNNQTSSGSMTIITEKVNLWIKKRENYRNLQSSKESVSQKTVYLGSEITRKLSDLRLKITKFAYESIKNELMQMETSEDETANEKCYCLVRRNYRLPCKHALEKYEGVIPLVAVHQKWRITYTKGRVVTIAKVAIENEKEDMSTVAAPIDDLKIRFEKLLDVFQVLGSQQERDDLLNGIDNLIRKFSNDRLESILPPKVVVTQKGRPKNTKRNKLGIEHENEEIKLE